jgi:hypothetical protein
VYDSVCCELAASILHEPSCRPHRNQTLIANSGAW